MRWSIDGLTIGIFVENNSAPLFKTDLFFLCSNFVTINEIINEILKVESDFALEVWVSIDLKPFPFQFTNCYFMYIRPQICS